MRIICTILSFGATKPNDKLSVLLLLIPATAIPCPEHPRCPSSLTIIFQRIARLAMLIGFFRLSSSSPPVIRPSIEGIIFRCPSSIYPPDYPILLPLCSISSLPSSSSAEISAFPRSPFLHLPFRCLLNTSTLPT